MVHDDKPRTPDPDNALDKWIPRRTMTVQEVPWDLIPAALLRRLVPEIEDVQVPTTSVAVQTVVSYGTGRIDFRALAAERDAAERDAAERDAAERDEPEQDEPERDDDINDPPGV